MANEKVSQMVSLTAGEVAGNDLFMVVDLSAKESKKISISDVISYFEATGSFSAHAVLADTASYILGSNVVGAIASASVSTTTISASHANNTDNSINAITASFALSGGSVSAGTTLFTGSTYQITSSVAVSSSYSVSSTFASSSIVAQNLQYTGVNNGTSSYSISSSNTITSSYSFHSDTASISITSSFSPFAVSSSNAITSSYSFISVSASLSNSASFATNAETSSYVSSFSSGLTRALCWATWSSVSGKFAVSANTLYKSYNISSITYVSTVNTGSTSIDSFIVTFLSPPSNVDYMFVGNVNGFIYGPQTATTYILPTQTRDTSGFTCSISMATSQETNFYHSASLTFEILGLP